MTVLSLKLNSDQTGNLDAGSKNVKKVIFKDRANRKNDNVTQLQRGPEDATFGIYRRGSTRPMGSMAIDVEAGTYELKVGVDHRNCGLTMEVTFGD